jgi:hypothetical protein
MDPSLIASLGSKAAATVQWAMESLSAADTPERRAEARAVMAPNWRDPARVPYLLASWGDKLGPHRVAGAGFADDGAVEVLLVDVRERRWVLRCELEPVAPRRIRTVCLSRELPPGVRVRAGRKEDLDGILALDRACPIVRNDGTKVWIDRGARWLDWLQLQGHSMAVIAEAEDRVIAVDAAALRDVRIGGRDYVLIYRHQTRVLPEWQRSGILWALTAFGAAQRSPLADGAHSFIDPRNDAMRTMFQSQEWKTSGFRAQLPCAALAGPAAGRPAVPDDAARIAALVNATHGRSETFVPYTIESLTERLARAPASYAWPQLRVDSYAFLGVWPVLERVTVETSNGRRESVRALALDWGFDGPHGLDELEALLHSACTELAAAGATHLSVFASDATPGADRVRGLAQTIAPFTFNCMIPEPPDTAERGLYVDPVFF